MMWHGGFIMYAPCTYIEGFRNALRSCARMILQHLLVSSCTAQCGEKQQKTLELSIYFVEVFEIPTECVCLYSSHSVVVW